MALWHVLLPVSCEKLGYPAGGCDSDQPCSLLEHLPFVDDVPNEGSMFHDTWESCAAPLTITQPPKVGLRLLREDLWEHQSGGDLAQRPGDWVNGQPLGGCFSQ